MKRIAIISNDNSCLPSLKFVKEKFPASVDYFVHSEDEGYARHKANFKRKSILRKLLSNTDFIIPLFQGFAGVYLLQSLFSVCQEINDRTVRIENALLDYINNNSIISPEEFSSRNIFINNAPSAPVFNFVLMENKIPSFLNNELLFRALNAVLISPNDFLSAVVSRLISTVELPKNGIVVNHIPDASEITELEERSQKFFPSKYILSKILSYFNIEANGQIRYLQALLRLLKDINSDKFTNIVFLDEQTEIHH